MVMYGRQRKPRPTIAKGRRKATRAPAASRAVMSVPRPTLRDLQFFDSNNTLSTNAAAWVYAPIFLPVQGTTSSSRYGDKTCAKSLQYFVYANTSPTQRVIIYYDRQPNGTNPASPAPMLTANTESFKDPDLRHRFQILRDFWIGNVGSGSIVSSNPSSSNLQRGYIRLDHISTFTANNGAIGDCATGAFGIAVYNGNTTASATITNTRILFES